LSLPFFRPSLIFPLLPIRTSSPPNSHPSTGRAPFAAGASPLEDALFSSTPSDQPVPSSSARFLGACLGLPRRRPLPSFRSRVFFCLVHVSEAGCHSASPPKVVFFCPFSDPQTSGVNFSTLLRRSLYRPRNLWPSSLIRPIHLVLFFPTLNRFRRTSQQCFARPLFHFFNFPLYSPPSSFSRTDRPLRPTVLLRALFFFYKVLPLGSGTFTGSKTPPAPFFPLSESMLSDALPPSSIFIVELAGLAS